MKKGQRRSDLTCVGNRGLTAACLSILVACASVVAVPGQTIDTTSYWDKTLLSVKLTNVHIRAESLTDAWQAGLSHQLGIRTVLYEPVKTVGRLDFAAKECTVRDVLNALVVGYTNYTYSTDKLTGITWLHPKAVAYEGILTDKVAVAKDEIAVPMVTGVLDELAQIKSLNMISAIGHGTFALATYDYPVNLPQGAWSVRDIVNFCCVARPTTVFYVYPSEGGPISMGISIIADQISSTERPPPMAIAYWQNQVGRDTQGAPTDEQVMDALASTDVRVRVAARHYLEMCWMTNLKAVLSQHFSPSEKGLWTAVGLTSVYVLTPGITLVIPVERMREILKDQSSASIGPGLKAMAAMELARIAGGPLAIAQRRSRPIPPEKQTEIGSKMEPLEQMANTLLSDSDIMTVKYDMIRVLRCSKPVRDKLLELKPQWAGFSTNDIAALGNMDIFSLP